MTVRRSLLAALAVAALACLGSGALLLLRYRPDAGFVGVDQLALELEHPWWLPAHYWPGALVVPCALLLALLPGARRSARVAWLAAAAAAGGAFWTGTLLAVEPAVTPDQAALTAAYWAHVLPLPLVAAGAAVLALLFTRGSSGGPGR